MNHNVHFMLSLKRLSKISTKKKLVYKHDSTEKVRAFPLIALMRSAANL